MVENKKLLSRLTTSQVVIIGLLAILAGNAFSWTFMNVKVHELLANVGALFLLVGTLQWFFDEDSRQTLISEVSENVRNYLQKRERFSELGISDCLIDSKGITDPAAQKEFIDSNSFAIGIHYSDGTIVRFEKILNERTSQRKHSQIAYVKDDGIAAEYLKNCLAHPVDIKERVNQLQNVIRARFPGSTHLSLVQHDRVLRYSFIYCDSSIWIIFLTNSDSYQPQIPALRIVTGSDLFDFFKQDIKNLGISV